MAAAAAAPARPPRIGGALALAALVHGAAAVGAGSLVAQRAPEPEAFVRLTMLDAVPDGDVASEIVPAAAPRPDIPQPDIPPPPAVPPPAPVEIPELPAPPAVAPPSDLAVPVDAAPEPVPDAARPPPPPPAPRPAARSVPMEQGIPTDYFNRFRSAVEGHALRSYPRRSIERGEEGTVTLLITLLEDGTVEDVRVAPGDADAPARLRNAAVRAARRVERFEALPPGTGTRVITLPIVYRIR